jgi:hypothetical protein
VLLAGIGLYGVHRDPIAVGAALTILLGCAVSLH